MEFVHFRAMNTDIYLGGEGDPARLTQGFDKTREFILESERRFTRFSPDSELSLLNRSAGEWFHASQDMVFIVMLAQDYIQKTNGLFDPSILPDLQRAGYDRSMDLIRQMDFVPPAPFGMSRSRSPLDGLIVNPEQGLIRLPAGISLDLGGIAKGWIVERAAAILAEFSPACVVNAGGDMMLVGLPAGEDSWQVSLEDPRQPDRGLTSLKVPPGAVATSSTTRRAWKQGNQQRHHLIDPRTGEPAESDWLSVTVIAPHADTCEVFAKALLIAGPQGAEALTSGEDKFSYLAVDRDGNLWGTLESMEYVHEQ